MTEAIFGLIGVIVGGLLNVGIAFLRTHHEQRQLARTAARLVLEELRENEAKMSVAEGQATWQPLLRLDETDWKSYRVDLANSLSDLEWSEVSHAFRWINSLREEVALHGANDAFDGTGLSFRKARGFVAQASLLIATRAGVKVKTLPPSFDTDQSMARSAPIAPSDPAIRA